MSQQGDPSRTFADQQKDIYIRRESPKQPHAEFQTQHSLENGSRHHHQDVTGNLTGKQLRWRKPTIPMKRLSDEHKEEEEEEEEKKKHQPVCIGMISTDIVVEKPPLMLIRDEQYEIVTLESEGKLNTENYSFRVTSRSIPPKFFGWVPFRDTKVLGPLVDHRLIWWDAVIPRGKANNARTPLYIILYCKPDILATLSNYFQSQQMYLKPPPFHNPICRYKNPHAHLPEAHQQFLQQQQSYRNSHSAIYYQRSEQEIQEKNKKDIEQLLNSIPTHVPLRLDGVPMEGLTIQLLDHQQKGIHWMIDRENNAPSQGGILADMGLGKTIQTIGLILSTMGEKKRTTLVVTPLALIHQWVEEIKSKTQVGKLNVLKHHGPSRTKNVNDFYDYDVVVTTYQVVASDMAEKARENGPLFQVEWYRVVLDEAQQIKNKQTKSSLSCTALKSTKRWCLTGTPIQNNIDELYSLFRFLNIQPLCDYPTFKKNISIPIQNGEVQIAMERLKAVLSAIMLRRTKQLIKEEKQDTSFQLPVKHRNDVLLTFHSHERALYELLLKRTKDTILSMNQQKYMNILCLLLRLRQACDHPQLILNALDKDVLDIVSENISWLNHDKQLPCELCGRPKDDMLFCRDCKDSILSVISKEKDSSAKIDKLVEILKNIQSNHPGEKVIVFSQFTSMLDLIETRLNQHQFAYCRYDGSMSSQQREKNLDRLKYDTQCKIMLISLKCGSLGLNLTSANHVILTDIWWNPAVEDQAVDRVHRIGQKLPVYVTRLLIDDSIELKILALQKKKEQLTKGALGENLIKSSTRLTLNEIKSLFDL